MFGSSVECRDFRRLKEEVTDFIASTEDPRGIMARFQAAVSQEVEAVMRLADQEVKKRGGPLRGSGGNGTPAVD